MSLSSHMVTIMKIKVQALDVCDQFNDLQATQDIYVVSGLHKPLVGRPSIKTLKIVAFINGIQVQDSIKCFPNLFAC